MNKEEYLLKKDEINKRFKQLNCDLAELKSLYIQCNKQFNHGDRIQIITSETQWRTIGSNEIKTTPEKNRFAYFERYNINQFSGDIEVICYKEKKDGTPSKIRDYVSRLETVSKIN